MSLPSSAYEQWRSYDTVADVYERVAVPWFAALAGELVAAVQIDPGSTVLDVGTGTGLVAEIVRNSVGPSGLVVGVDPSIRMLAVAVDQRRLDRAIAALTPGLPFPAHAFDAVVASLVISHVHELDRGLRDMVRVLHRGGRFGVTAWASDPYEDEDQSVEADQIVAAVRERHDLVSRPAVDAVPWEELLRSRSKLFEALRAAGVEDVKLQRRTYRYVFSVSDYLAGWGSLGRYLRWYAGAERWSNFVDAAEQSLRDRFGEAIVSVKQVWIATGAAPY
jgi:ubiquinone/menaquinone biosynthesis C-methylase UbiE